MFGLLLCPQYRTHTKLGCRLLCVWWTFKLSTVKEINLFLPAHVFLGFLLFCLLSCFLSYDLVSPFLVSPLTIACPVPPSSSCLSFALLFLLLYEGQVQGSPITLRGLRKLYGLCPRGCHVALSSGRLQVRSSHWLLAQPPQRQP